MAGMALQEVRTPIEPPEVLDVDEDEDEVVQTRASSLLSSLRSEQSAPQSNRGSQPGTGQPGAGQPGAGQPGAGQPGTGMVHRGSILRSSTASLTTTRTRTSFTSACGSLPSSALQEEGEDEDKELASVNYFSSDSDMIAQGLGNRDDLDENDPDDAMPKALKERWEHHKAKHREDFVTALKTPPGFDMVLAATGIANLNFRIEQERERRADEYFVHDYPVIYGIVISTKFEVAVACAVIVNCLLIGWEGSVDEGTLADFFGACEHLFTLFFLVEWCMRVLAFGWVWVFEFLNAFDTFIVFATGVLLKWVMEPMGWQMTVLRRLTVLRTFRLARLVQVVRHAAFFKELWMLVKGLSNSVRSLFWAFAIGFLVVYIFAVAATEVIGRRDMFQDDEHIQRCFGNVARSMLTMFQLMTLDDWGFDLARPPMQKDNSLGILFICFLGVGVFVFWNLITAVIIDNAERLTQTDSAQLARNADAQKKHDLKVLGDVFVEMDRDGSGELSLDEFDRALRNKKVRQKLDSLDLSASDLHDVWGLLDDGDGLLTIKEFTNGMRRMKGRAKAKDLVDTTKRLRHTVLSHAELEAQVNQFGSALESLEDDLKTLASDTGEVVGLFTEMYHRLQVHIDRTKREDKKAARLKAHDLKQREVAEAEAEVELEAEEEAEVVEEDFAQGE